MAKTAVRFVWKVNAVCIYFVVCLSPEKRSRETRMNSHCCSHSSNLQFMPNFVKRSKNVCVKCPAPIAAVEQFDIAVMGRCLKLDMYNFYAIGFTPLREPYGDELRTIITSYVV
ncbi:MAG: hypothetical protein WCR36_08570 [Bacteroidaceae bacterium]